MAERGEHGVKRLGHRRDARPLSLPGELCASLEGFSLHAKAALEADDHEGRERLARYLARPPLASERLSLAADGRVVYAPPKALEGQDAGRGVRPARLHRATRTLVPRPHSSPDLSRSTRSGAEWRDWIVPAQPRSTRSDPSRSLAAKALRPKSRGSWAELLEREIDVLTCPWVAGGKRKLIALLTDGALVRRILEYLGRPTTAPTLAPARSPPELEFAG